MNNQFNNQIPNQQQGQVQQPQQVYGNQQLYNNYLAMIAEKKEKRGFAVTALVFAVIATTISWIPFLNYLTIPLSVLAIIFGIIALVVNIGRTKGATATGFVFSVIGIIAFFISSYFYSQYFPYPTVLENFYTMFEPANRFAKEGYQTNDDDIESIETYGDYLDAYTEIYQEYIDEVGELSKDNSGINEEEVNEIIGEYNEALEQEKEKYKSIRRKKLTPPLKEGAVEFLKEFRDTSHNYIRSFKEQIENAE